MEVIDTNEVHYQHFRFHVREYKTVLDSGYHAVDSGFQSPRLTEERVLNGPCRVIR